MAYTAMPRRKEPKAPAAGTTIASTPACEEAADEADEAAEEADEEADEPPAAAELLRLDAAFDALLDAAEVTEAALEVATVEALLRWLAADD
ncbi:hypothetical protein LTR66_015883 [Elasticomyces elasticus]|nr:hypothetical protein LTR66_015883 [Elasticomyces elasticus]